MQWGLIVTFRVGPDVLSLYKSGYPQLLPLLSGKQFPFQIAILEPAPVQWESESGTVVWKDPGGQRVLHFILKERNSSEG